MLDHVLNSHTFAHILIQMLCKSFEKVSRHYSGQDATARRTCQKEYLCHFFSPRQALYFLFHRRCERAAKKIASSILLNIFALAYRRFIFFLNCASHAKLNIFLSLACVGVRLQLDQSNLAKFHSLATLSPTPHPGWDKFVARHTRGF